jgi:hypothetical protein
VGKLFSLAFLILLLAVPAPPAFAGLALALEPHLESLSGSGWRARRIDLKVTRGFGGEGVLQVSIPKSGERRRKRIRVDVH